MLMSASPGRSAAMAPVERSELPGHRQRSPNSAAPTVGQRHPFSLPPRARARRRRFQRALRQTDLHRPAGRRCGCWPTSTFLFSGIVVGRFRGRTLELGSGADADVGFAWSGGGDGAGRAQRATGSSTTIAKFCSTDSGGALPRSLSAAAAADRKDQRNLAASPLLAAPTRAQIIGKQGGC